MGIRQFSDDRIQKSDARRQMPEGFECGSRKGEAEGLAYTDDRRQMTEAFECGTGSEKRKGIRGQIAEGFEPGFRKIKGVY